MRERWLILLFSFFILILYANSITGDFLIDDTFLVRDNPYIERFSNLISYFTSGTKEFGRPIRLISFYLDTAIFGKNTIGYHISNIIYYTLFCSLAYFFCQVLFKNKYLSITFALLFISHPLHTEGVAYISGRKDILGGIFSFSSLICFVYYLKTPQRIYSLLVLLFFLLAIASKEIYAILPLLFPAVGYYQEGNLKRHKFFYAGLAMGAGIFLLYVIFFRNRALFDYFHTIPVYGNNNGINFPTAVKICACIFYLNFFPFSPSADYTFNTVKRITVLDPTFGISILTLIFCALGAYYLRKKQRSASFGLLWMLICLLPVCQLVPYPEIISERSLILLSFGTCLIVSAFIVNNLPKKYGIGMLVIILFIFSLTTIKRNRDWNDDLSLWMATVKQHPDCARARYNLGIALAKTKQFRAAEKEFLVSLTINPPDLITVPDYSYDALLNLGNTYTFLGEYSRAKKHYQIILRHDRNNQRAIKNLRIVEGLEKQSQEYKADTGKLPENLQEPSID